MYPEIFFSDMTGGTFTLAPLWLRHCSLPVTCHKPSYRLQLVSNKPVVTFLVTQHHHPLPKYQIILLHYRVVM